jgi:hypothetical protein
MMDDGWVPMGRRREEGRRGGDMKEVYKVHILRRDPGLLGCGGHDGDVVLGEADVGGDSEVGPEGFVGIRGWDVLSTRGFRSTLMSGIDLRREIIAFFVSSWRLIVAGSKEGQISAWPKSFGFPHRQVSSLLAQRMW